MTPSLGKEELCPHPVLSFCIPLGLGCGHMELCMHLGTSDAWLTQHVCLPLGSKPLGGGFFLPDGTVLPPLTVPPGAALLDLEQTTLPGIAHLVVETMIVSDQIRPEDRASVLRTLLLKHRCQGGAPGRAPSGSAAFQEHRLY